MICPDREGLRIGFHEPQRAATPGPGFGIL